jgi:hypothetical protein
MLADLIRELGVPASRIRLVPPPGTATVRDLQRANDVEGFLCELIDGTLVEKAMGWFESRLVVVLGSKLDRFVVKHRLGIVLGADGITRLLPRKYRSADVAFIHKSRFPAARSRSRPTRRSCPTSSSRSFRRAIHPRKCSSNAGISSAPGRG